MEVKIPKSQKIPQDLLEQLSKFDFADIAAALIPDHRNLVPVFRKGAVGPFFIRPMRFGGVGSIVVGHAHNYDHMTYLIRGSVSIRFWPIDPRTRQRMGSGPIEEKQYTAPMGILIKKNMAHELVALEENTIADCIYVHRDDKGNVIEEYCGNEHAAQMNGPAIRRTNAKL